MSLDRDLEAGDGIGHTGTAIPTTSLDRPEWPIVIDRR